MRHAKDLYLTHVALYMTVEIGPLVKIDYHSYICESICRTKVSFLAFWWRNLRLMKWYRRDHKKSE